jgi:cytochrome b
MHSKNTTPTTKVWDPMIRVGHWILVTGFFLAYFIEAEDATLAVHVWAGYVVAAVVLVRIIWGFVGSQHARFVDFIFSPRAMIVYLRDLILGSARRYLGHSPAGAAMIFLLIISLTAITWSGLMVYAYEDQAGPFAGFVAESKAVSPTWALISTTKADSDEYEEKAHKGKKDSDPTFEAREEYWEELHEFFANFTLFLVILHVGGVLLASFVHRENLVASMLTGRKRAEIIEDRELPRG